MSKSPETLEQIIAKAIDRKSTKKQREDALRKLLARAFMDLQLIAQAMRVIQEQQAPSNAGDEG